MPWEPPRHRVSPRSSALLHAPSTSTFLSHTICFSSSAARVCLSFCVYMSVSLSFSFSLYISSCLPFSPGLSYRSRRQGSRNCVLQDRFVVLLLRVSRRNSSCGDRTVLLRTHSDLRTDRRVDGKIVSGSSFWIRGLPS